MKSLAIVTLLALTCLLASPARLAGADEPATAAGPDRAALEKQLAEKLTHSRMIGFYSTIGQEGPPKQDEYTLGAVEKKEGDKWLFSANLQFGKRTMDVPLEVPVLWAGDTPVISVTDFTIPGMGVYTARVMIYGDSYAGTWSSAKHGGYMWGRLEKIPADKQSNSPPTGQAK
jgi:hypothetical protein